MVKARRSRTPSGRLGGGAGRADSGHLRKIVEQTGIEAANARRIAIGLCRKARPERQHALGAKSGDRPPSASRSCAATSRRRRAVRRRSRAAPPTSVPKIRRSRLPVDVRLPSFSADAARPRQLEGGQHAAEQRGHDRQRRGEQKHPRVKPDLVEARQRRRCECDERSRQPDREHQAEDAADRRQERRFGEQLANQAPAAGAEGAAHRDLALARHGARQHQAGDVGARDQQYEADGGEDDPEQRSRPADDFVGQRRRGAAERARPDR